MRGIFLYVLVLSITNVFSQSGYNNKAKKMKIVYIGDPMCSWCYGISNELIAVKEAFEDQLGFDVIVGGLRPGGGDEWNAEFKGFLKHHWEEVNTRSGMPFGYKLFERDAFLYDTEPSCRAVVIARELNEDKTMIFFKMVQKGFYLENRDPKDVDFYKEICTATGIDFAVFKTKFEDPRYKAKTVEDFQYSAKVGVRSFPTVLFQKDGQLYPIAQGFATKETMTARIKEFMN